MSKEVIVKVLELTTPLLKQSHVRLIGEKNRAQSETPFQLDIRLVQPNEDSIPYRWLAHY